MQAKFNALIKLIKIKSEKSLDKTCQVLLEFNGNDTTLLNKIVEIHKSDAEVPVALGE